MGGKVMTVDQLAVASRRLQVLRYLAAAGGPKSSTGVMRAMAPPDQWGDAERQRVRSALRTLRTARWADTGDQGWFITSAGCQALAEVDAAHNARPAAA